MNRIDFIKALLITPLLNVIKPTQAAPVFDIDKAFKAIGAKSSYRTAIVDMSSKVSNWKTVITRYIIDTYCFEYTHHTKVVEVTSNTNSLIRAFIIKDQATFDFMIYDVRNNKLSVEGVHNYLKSTGYRETIGMKSHDYGHMQFTKENSTLLCKWENKDIYLGNLSNDNGSVALHLIRGINDIRTLFGEGKLI